MERHTGVSRINKRWRAVIHKDCMCYNIGYFDTEQEAINARNEKAIELGVNYKVDDLDGEIWVSLAKMGDNYKISNKGRIKSLNYKKGGYEKILKPSVGRNNLYYLFIKPHAAYQIHRLVMEAFYGESDLQVNHKDKNGLNNCLENLEYVTNRENSSHRFGGAKGCSYINGRWRAGAKINGKELSLGTFSTYEEAHQRYIDALKEQGIENRYLFEGKVA